MAAQGDVFLQGNERVVIAHLGTFGDANLRLHDINPSHHLGDGVLDLNTRVDLNEVIFAGIDIEQILDGARVAVICFSGQT